MLARVLDTISQHRLIEPGQRVLVGLSGGPDSWALLLGLQRLKLKIELFALCVDHALRPESALEAKGVAQQCRALGVDCAVVRVDVVSKRTAHVSWQDAARRARLEALEESAARLSCEVVALGHNANDQAETVLFRIVRGTGLKGLAGIPYKRGPFIRPLLDVTRAQIERFLATAKVIPVRDPSNGNPKYARARVRNEWLPWLARENPKIVDALLALSGEARNLPAVLPTPDSVLGSESSPVVSRRVAKVVGHLARKGGSGRVSVKGGELQVSYGRTRFAPSCGPALWASPEPRIVNEAPGGQVFAWGEGHLSLSTRQAAGAFSALGKGGFALETIVFPLTVRGWEPGDRMRPRGGRGSRKLQDLFVDAKVPRGQRRRLPVVVDARGTVLFVPGLRPAETGKPTLETQSVLDIEAKNFVISL